MCVYDADDNHCLFCDTIAANWDKTWEIKHEINSLEPPEIDPKRSVILRESITMFTDHRTYPELLQMCNSLRNIAYYITSMCLGHSEYLCEADVEIMEKLKNDIIKIYGLNENPIILEMLHLLLEICPRQCFAELYEEEAVEGIVFNRDTFHKYVHDDMDYEAYIPPWCQKRKINL
jgi:hypothetical protein